MGTNLTGDQVVFVSADARQSHVAGSVAARPIETPCNAGQSLSLNLLDGSTRHHTGISMVPLKGSVGIGV